jgi:hypothetical protein
MPLVIMTKRVFLLCDDIISITLQPNGSKASPATKGLTVKKKKGVKTAPDADNRGFYIQITFVPPNSNSVHREQEQLDIDVVGLAEAETLFTSIVREIREQKPDQIYLDKLFTQVLGEEAGELVPKN